MEIQELALTAARAFGLYILMLVVIRAMGKRTVGNFSAFDLLVALMLGEVVDEIVYGDVSILQGVTSIVVIAAAKYFTSWLSYSNPRLNKIIDGTPTVLVRNGNLQPKGLSHELMNQKEVMAALRLEGVSDMREVKLATMEVDGLVSVIKKEWAENLQKIDLEQESKEEEKVPADKQTDSREALGVD
jgi:uncharacterized membrane protein YcaP (DUF421 family)